MFFGDDDTFWGLLLLLAAFFFLLAVPALAIAAYRRTSRYRDEIATLQHRLLTLERQIQAGPPTAAPVATPAPDIVLPAAPIVDTVARTGESAVPPVPDAAPVALEPVTPTVEVPAMPVEIAAASAGQNGKPRREGLEQRLGARGFVWIGGLSIALAGAFLVKYSVDEGLLSPALRVGIGGLFGVVLLVAGEWMRQRSATIGQALTAAGIGDLFASLFAATALYDLIPSPVGFGLLTAVTLIAVPLALRHGPFVGLVGLAGGFLTPAIVSSSEPHPVILFSFLFLLLLGSFLLWRRRRWWYVAAVGLAGNLIWVAMLAGLNWIDPGGQRIGEISLPIFVLAIAALSIWAFHAQARILGAVDGTAAKLTQIEQAIIGLGSLAGAGLLAYWLALGDYRLFDWAALLVLMVLHLLAGRRFTAHELIGFAIAAIVVATYALMPVEIRPRGQTASVDMSATIIALGLVIGGLLTFGGFALSFGARLPVRWSALSVLGSAASFAVAYIDFRDRHLLFTWPVICALLALLHMLAAERLMQRRGSDPAYKGGFALHCLAVLGFIAAAVPLLVGAGWVAVIWSLLLPAVVWIAERLDEVWLRRVLWVAVPGILMALFLSGFPVGDRPILNWLLYGIGIPFLGFAASGRLLRRTPPAHLVRGDVLLILLVDLTAAFLGFLLVSLEVRQLFHGSALMTASFDLAEVATLVILWLAAAWFLTGFALREHEPKLIWAALLLAGLGAAAVVLGPLSLLNPLFNAIPVGATPILNRGLYAFILPAICAVIVARSFSRAVALSGIFGRNEAAGLKSLQAVLGAIALITGFAGVSILNRQLFVGTDVIWPGSAFLTDVASAAELYGYSVAWLIYGGLLVVLGLVTGSRPLRHAAAGVILLAVLKVFLVDAAGLTGLYRVASFLGLGLCLIALGYLYQRFVLRSVDRAGS